MSRRPLLVGLRSALLHMNEDVKKLSENDLKNCRSQYLCFELIFVKWWQSDCKLLMMCWIFMSNSKIVLKREAYFCFFIKM